MFPDLILSTISYLNWEIKFYAPKEFQSEQ